MSGTEETTVNNRSNDPLFIGYMRAFAKSVKHIGICLHCQDEKPCAEGDPIHSEFNTLQNAWTEKVRAEGKKL
ncbi:hypothetical protein ACFY7C_29860 [Streptomyces sp. NPDC012769]|uniref:hypothetical protein n=1 Tax=Streptomyces sp. NPDC012769 TaxID=3364848 RepID=UPI0036A90B1D